MEHEVIKYWSTEISNVFQNLNSSPEGINSEEAQLRLNKYGENCIESKEKISSFILLLNQFKNPIIIILLIATAISASTGEIVDSVIITAIIFISAILSFLQEYSANNAMEALNSNIQIKAMVLRDNDTVKIPANEVVPGDILILSAGSLIAADGAIIECLDFSVNQAILTGESISTEKRPGIVNEESSLDQRFNCVYMGTNVQYGSAKVLVTATGENTEYGKIAQHLERKQPETEFEKGVRHFGYLLSEMMFILTIAVFFINVLFHKPAIDSLLFSVALAVGLTPQLLPAIISITLSKGSKIMAKEGVIVKRLSSIENFGSMDILCTDKTGTLTKGSMQLDGAVDAKGVESDNVFNLAYRNAFFQTGLENPLDNAIEEHKKINTDTIKKINEIPYDFTRKRLSVIINENNEYIMITKGALNKILPICSHVQLGEDIKQLDENALNNINELYVKWSNLGMRVLGISKKNVILKDSYDSADETGMIFAGFLLFMDPPKEDVKQTILDLAENSVELRIITGDNKFVAMHIAESVGIDATNVLTGSDLLKINNEALLNLVEKTTIFAEVDPNQKERIILALKKRKHVVGYMGDGVNDVLALHAADIGVSVDTAADVAKESADFVLLEKSLKVLNRGIELGRTTFENTMKYILITTSANFGNMFSMAGASLFMKFLPLLPKQILLINFLTDFPAITIVSDDVDKDVLKYPRRWDIKFIRNFMFIFGFISSLFDYIAFGVLLLLFNANERLFQSSWFMLSIITELMVLLIMRTRKPFIKSKPAPLLLLSIVGMGLTTVFITYFPIGAIFDLEPIPLKILITLLGIISLYILATEIGKYAFYNKQ